MSIVPFCSWLLPKISYQNKFGTRCVSIYSTNLIYVLCQISIQTSRLLKIFVGHACINVCISHADI